MFITNKTFSTMIQQTIDRVNTEYVIALPYSQYLHMACRKNGICVLRTTTTDTIYLRLFYYNMGQTEFFIKHLLN